MMSFFKKNKNISENKFGIIDPNSFMDFIDYSISPIIRAEIEGKFLFANQAFAKMLNYLNRADLLEVNFKNDLFAAKENWNSFFSDLQKKEKLSNYKIDLLQKTGNIISVEFDGRLVKDEDGKPKYFEGIITKRENFSDNYSELLKEVEQLREKQKSSDSQVSKANYTKNVKSQYLANMTHEIKTPINSIVGFLTLIEQHLFESEEELQDFAQSARISADSLLEIINNILDISKIEAGKMELDEAEFNLVQEVEKAKSIALPAGGKNNLEITTNISDKLKGVIIGDALRYRQVLMNILTNSIKYTESGSIEISVQIEKEHEVRTLIKTTVKDTGIGIPKDKLSSLFQPYTQIKTKKWNKRDGSGLGLMISKELVHLMDGEIIIKSKEGVGTIVEFTTSMKLAKTDSNQKEFSTISKEEHKDNLSVVGFEKISTKEMTNDINFEKKKDSPSEVEASKFIGEFVNSSDFNEKLQPNVKRILLVEDNPISQKVELKLLKENGYHVNAVSNGYDAVEAVKSHSFNLVLMDVEMAGMDGLEATKRIRALEPPTSKIPIIAVTAHSSMKDREKCLASGMDDYIAKPININFMKITIDHWLLKVPTN
ncbi:MAG: response regulator [Bacteroidetes bacterium]|nr:response regulator [Bacteroidota bacterium]MBU1116705.1 response regulator [Bacteroidota bacterium]MBU1799821.1 response regulator [Bacteroidota bacterium]